MLSAAGSLQRQRKCIQQGGLGRHIQEIDTQVDDRLWILRPHSTDNAIRTIRRGSNGFRKVLSNHRVHSGNAVMK